MSKTKEKIRLALLAGGVSGEREVSLAGAKGVEAALDPERYLVRRYDPACDLARLAAEKDEIDCAFILLHGMFGEDGTIQGFLDLLGIPYQGSGVLGSALAMDKHRAKIVYQYAGLSVPGWVMVGEEERAQPSRLLDRFALPLVVKPVRQGSSLGMTIVDEPDALGPAIEEAFAHDREVMVEEYISGREVTGGVLGNQELEPLPVVEIIPGEAHRFFDYQAKYTPGASREVCPAELSPALTAKVQEAALVAHRALGLTGYSRTDMIIREDLVYVLETNTIPGMTPTSLFPQAAQAHGLSFPRLLDRLIELALEAGQSRLPERSG